MLTFFEVSAAPGYEFTFDVDVILQSLIRFPPKICEALELPGGCSLNLANNLMSSHKSDNGEFGAGKLCVGLRIKESSILKHYMPVPWSADG